MPDPRLEQIAALVSPQKVVPTAMEFVDIAGLVAGASKGEGLGNQFLANIRETDAIAHDELDLAPGIARLKVGGGLAGHNGLKDVARALGGSRDFVRMRLGIGHPGKASEVVHYVLKKPSVGDLAEIERAIDEGSHVFGAVVDGRFEEAMLRLHTRPEASDATEQKE